MLDLWYENALIYCVDVETYRDGNGDGVGDFAGMTMSLDHLQRLGVDCLWLNPFYPTPNRDNGTTSATFTASIHDSARSAISWLSYTRRGTTACA